MKNKFRHLLILALIFGAGSNCASVYMKNRANDARDIFTAEVQTKAYGVSARLGPVKAGVFYKSPEGKAWGLRGGWLGKQFGAEFTALLFGADYFLAEPLKFLQKKKKKTAPVLKPVSGTDKEDKEDDSKDTDSKSGKDSDKPNDSEDDKEDDSDDDSQEPENNPDHLLVRLRKKEYLAKSPFGTRMKAGHYKSLLKSKKKVFVTAPYFTQMEISAGLYYGFKLGFNPGELLDFLLGWLTIDIYKDDAPYPDPNLKGLDKNPLFKNLDPAAKKKLLEELSNQ